MLQTCENEQTNLSALQETNQCGTLGRLAEGSSNPVHLSTGTDAGLHSEDEGRGQAVL